MSKRKLTTAVVFVDKSWYDSTLRFLLDKSPSRSTEEVHILVGALKDAGDTVGLWMSGLKTKEVKPGVEVAMELLIPWRYVVAVGLIDEANPRIGFEGGDVTILK